MFALSTAWNANRCRDGATIIKEIVGLGIKEVELSFSLTKKTLQEAASHAKKKQVRICSLHNYCPIPEELSPQEALPDCFSLSSTDEDERKKAIEYTKITISTAKQIDASVVVLHCGRVEIEDKTRQLIGLAKEGMVNSPAYKDIFESFVKERDSRSPDYFAQIIRSLKELCAYAQQKDVVLGIENRFYYREIPSLQELEIIFNQFKTGYIAYWHDIGHDYILGALGLIKPRALLENFGSRLYGAHLHNIKNLEDHQAPVDGEFDFNTLKPYIHNKTLKVIEAHGHVSSDLIKKSVSYLKGIFGD